MPGARRIAFLALPTLGALAACALAYPYDDLTGGAGAGDAGVDSPLDASADATLPEAAADAPADAPPDASVDAPDDAGLAFFDGFDRDAAPDSLGNNWIMKQQAAFILSNSLVVVQGGNGTDYRDNVVYRPSGEDILDVEASVELHVNSLPPGNPQVLVRVQSSTVAQIGSLDGYVLFIANTTNNATLARQHGNSIYTSLTGIPLTFGINTTDTFRLRLSAVGAGTAVSLSAFVEYLSGGNWNVSGSANFTDSDNARIVSPGSVGFSSDVGDLTNTYAYGNFRRTPL